MCMYDMQCKVCLCVCKKREREREREKWCGLCVWSVYCGMRYMVWDVCVVSGIRMCGIWYGIDVAYVWICVSCGMRCVWYSVYVCVCVCVCVYVSWSVSVYGHTSQ